MAYLSQLLWNLKFIENIFKKEYDFIPTITVQLGRDNFDTEVLLLAYVH